MGAETRRILAQAEPRCNRLDATGGSCLVFSNLIEFVPMIAIQRHPLHRENLDRILETGFAKAFAIRLGAMSGAVGLIGTILVNALLRTNRLDAGTAVAAVARTITILKGGT